MMKEININIIRNFEKILEKNNFEKIIKDIYNSEDLDSLVKYLIEVELNKDAYGSSKIYKSIYLSLRNIILKLCVCEKISYLSNSNKYNSSEFNIVLNKFKIKNTFIYIKGMAKKENINTLERLIHQKYSYLKNKGWRNYKTCKERHENPKKIYRKTPKSFYKITLDQCKLCGSKFNLNRNHIIPYALGGSHNKENIIILCKYCHEPHTHITNLKTLKRNKLCNDDKFRLIGDLKYYGLFEKKQYNLSPEKILDLSYYLVTEHMKKLSEVSKITRK